MALAGCTTAMPVPGAATKAPLATAAPAAGSTLQPAPAATGTPVDPSGYTTPDGVAFASTDANTVCTISGTPTGAAPSANCSIKQKDFVFPALTAGTPSSVTVSGTAKGTTTLTDVTASGARALTAGHSITWSTMTCVAIENGIRCTNAATSHGFFVSRIKYELF